MRATLATSKRAYVIGRCRQDLRRLQNGNYPPADTLEGMELLGQYREVKRPFGCRNLALVPNLP